MKRIPRSADSAVYPGQMYRVPPPINPLVSTVSILSIVVAALVIILILLAVYIVYQNRRSRKHKKKNLVPPRGFNVESQYVEHVQKHGQGGNMRENSRTGSHHVVDMDRSPLDISHIPRKDPDQETPASTAVREPTVRAPADEDPIVTSDRAVNDDHAEHAGIDGTVNGQTDKDYARADPIAKASVDDDTVKVSADEGHTGKHRAVKVPVVETPVVESPVVEDPVVETPVVESPVVKVPVVETPVVESPVVEDPVVETPVVESPVVETPAVDDPEYWLYQPAYCYQDYLSACRDKWHQFSDYVMHRSVAHDRPVCDAYVSKSTIDRRASENRRVIRRGTLQSSGTPNHEQLSFARSVLLPSRDDLLRDHKREEKQKVVRELTDPTGRRRSSLLENLSLARDVIIESEDQRNEKRRLSEQRKVLRELTSHEGQRRSSLLADLELARDVIIRSQEGKSCDRRLSMNRKAVHRLTEHPGRRRSSFLRDIAMALDVITPGHRENEARYSSVAQGKRRLDDRRTSETRKVIKAAESDGKGQSVADIMNLAKSILLHEGEDIAHDQLTSKNRRIIHALTARRGSLLESLELAREVIMPTKTDAPQQRKSNERRKVIHTVTGEKRRRSSLLENLNFARTVIISQQQELDAASKQNRDTIRKKCSSISLASDVASSRRIILQGEQIFSTENEANVRSDKFRSGFSAPLPLPAAQPGHSSNKTTSVEVAKDNAQHRPRSSSQPRPRPNSADSGVEVSQASSQADVCDAEHAAHSD